MKGWIKVHTIPDDKVMNIRSVDISTVGTGVLKNDETKEATCISLNIDCCASSYAVSETVDEVLALIEEAEGESAPQKKNEEAEEKSIKNPTLYESLREIREFCKKKEDCEGCKYKQYGFCVPKASLGQRPRYWKLKEIREMFR